MSIRSLDRERRLRRAGQRTGNTGERDRVSAGFRAQRKQNPGNGISSSVELDRLRQIRANATRRPARTGQLHTAVEAVHRLELQDEGCRDAPRDSFRRGKRSDGETSGRGNRKALRNRSRGSVLRVAGLRSLNGAGACSAQRCGHTRDRANCGGRGSEAGRQAGTCGRGESQGASRRLWRNRPEGDALGDLVYCKALRNRSRGSVLRVAGLRGLNGTRARTGERRRRTRNRAN